MEGSLTCSKKLINCWGHMPPLKEDIWEEIMKLLQESLK